MQLPATTFCKVCCFERCLMHAVITHMTRSQVCDDTIEEDDGQGNQKIFRVIRIPFRVVFVSGNLKLRFHVQQSREAGKVRIAEKDCAFSQQLALFDAQLCIYICLALEAQISTSVRCCAIRCYAVLQVNFVNVKEGRLITKLLAEFDVTPCRGHLPSATSLQQTYALASSTFM